MPPELITPTMSLKTFLKKFFSDCNYLYSSLMRTNKYILTPKKKEKTDKGCDCLLYLKAVKRFFIKQ